jgi:hypothetical protein
MPRVWLFLKVDTAPVEASIVLRAEIIPLTRMELTNAQNAFSPKLGAIHAG